MEALKGGGVAVSDPTGAFRATGSFYYDAFSGIGEALSTIASVDSVPEAINVASGISSGIQDMWLPPGAQAPQDPSRAFQAGHKAATAGAIIAMTAGGAGAAVTRMSGIVNSNLNTAKSWLGASLRKVQAARAAPMLGRAGGDLLAKYGPRVAAQSGGRFNVVTHADATSAWVLRGGDWIKVSHRGLAQFIQKMPGFKGQPLRIVGCNAGSCAAGLGQNLANKLGVSVEAATSDVLVHSNGSFSAAGWRVFTPGL
jgi:hypothetical protein